MAGQVRSSQKRKRTPAQQRPAADDKESGENLVIECRYANGLPKPPVPKLLRALPSVSRLSRYRPTLLELDSRPALLSEANLTRCVELVDAEAYGELPAQGSMPPPLPPQDAVLLGDDDLSREEKEAQAKRQRLEERSDAFHREAFGLQLPQLITNDVFTERQRYTTGMEATEKKLFREAPGYASLEDLSQRIEKTFEAAKRPPVHPTDPTKKAKRVMPVVPDAVLWTNRYRQVICDEYKEEPRTDDILLKSVPTPRATCFSYFSPAADGTGKFGLTQSYIWDNRGAFTTMARLTEGECVLLSFPGDEEEGGEVRFMVAPTVMRLKKQKASRLDIAIDATSLSVSHREPTDEEQQSERERMSAVLLDEEAEDVASTSLDYVDGEWQIRSLREQSSHTGTRAGEASAGDVTPVDSPRVATGDSPRVVTA